MLNVACWTLRGLRAACLLCVGWKQSVASTAAGSDHVHTQTDPTASVATGVQCDLGSKAAREELAAVRQDANEARVEVEDLWRRLEETVAAKAAVEVGHWPIRVVAGTEAGQVGGQCNTITHPLTSLVSPSRNMHR